MIHSSPTKTAFLRVATNSLLLLSEGLIGRLSSFFLTLAVVRHLSVSNYGIYGSILSFMAIAMATAEFGISTVLTREVAQKKNRSGELFSGAIILAVPLFLITGTGVILVAILCDYAHSFVVLLSLATIGILGNTLVLIAGAILRALERMTFLSTINSLILTVAAVSGIVWVQYGASVRELVILFAVTPVINAMVLIFYVVLRFAPFSLSLGSHTWTDILQQAVPLSIFNGCAIVLLRYDILLLSKARNMTETGIYCAARNITDTLSLLVVSVVGAVFPFVAARWGESTEGAVRHYEQTLRFFTIIGIAATCGVFLLSEKIILLFYQDRYVESALCLKVLIWSFMFNAIGGPVAMFLIITKERLRHYIPYAIAVTLVNVVLNMWLTPTYGNISASYIAAFTSLLLFVFKMMALGDILPVRPRWVSISWRPLVAGIVMAGVLYWFQNYSLAALITLGFFTYIITLIVLGEFTYDYKIAMTYLRKKART